MPSLFQCPDRGGSQSSMNRWIWFCKETRRRSTPITWVMHRKRSKYGQCMYCSDLMLMHKHCKWQYWLWPCSHKKWEIKYMNSVTCYAFNQDNWDNDKNYWAWHRVMRVFSGPHYDIICCFHFSFGKFLHDFFMNSFLIL